jgi:hypothetical protein
MKKILIVICILFAINATAQDTYQYYFVQGRPTGKLEVEVWPEKGIVYPDIDTLLVSKREKNKKGVEEIEGKKYESFSAFFNALATTGLEFVNYYKWNTAGGAAGVLGGRLEGDYFIFRKKVVR